MDEGEVRERERELHTKKKGRGQVSSSLFLPSLSNQ